MPMAHVPEIGTENWYQFLARLYDLETAELLSAYFKEVYIVEDMTNLPMVTEKDLKWNDADLALRDRSNGKTTEIEN